jgi:hypothetical protein
LAHLTVKQYKQKRIKFYTPFSQRFLVFAKEEANIFCEDSNTIAVQQLCMNIREGQKAND